MDWFKLSYTLLGGLGIFFFGMKNLSESLQATSSHLIRRVIHSLTSNSVVAVGVGLVITCFVQSSSITTVMVVGFVNAGLMHLSQAIGVIFGANIGTTITGWIISVKIGKYSLLLIGLGIFPFLFSKNDRYVQWAKVCFALGFVFLGLQTMSGAFKPLRSQEDFLSLMGYFSADSYFSLWMTVLVGCLLTFVIQSSSAMLGITIALASTGAISFQTALGLVLGENIGTTITALLACIGANVSAKRAALAHALFNVLGVIVITSFFWQYKEFIEGIIGGAADFVDAKGEKPYIAAHIAAGHTLFNVANVLLFLPFIKKVEQLVTFLIPQKTLKKEKHLEFLGDPQTLSPTLAIEQAYMEIGKLAGLVLKILNRSKEHLTSFKENKDYAALVRKYEQITDRIQLEVMVFMEKVMKVSLTEEESHQVSALMRISDELESVADYGESIIKYSERFFSEDLKIDDETKKEIDVLFDKTINFFVYIKDIYEQRKIIDAKKYSGKIIELNELAEALKHSYLVRLHEKRYPALSSLTISDVIVALRRIRNHSENLAEAYMGMPSLGDNGF
ncbi:MAG: Na/Pi cotransporter family protein [Bdellovibrionota bacterium]